MKENKLQFIQYIYLKDKKKNFKNSPTLSLIIFSTYLVKIYYNKLQIF